MTFKTPSKTSVYKNEYKPDKYIIPFAPELIEFILKDLKLTTYRFGNKYDYLNIGDIVKIQNSKSKQKVAKAKIIEKSRTTFKELPLKNETHESFDDKEHQRQVLSGYYAYIGRLIKDDDEFLVFSFKIIN